MLWQTLAAAAIGYGGYRIWLMRKASQNAAYADNQPHSSHLDVRDAGPDAMRDPPKTEWTATDERLDESFPASDPPGKY